MQRGNYKGEIIHCNSDDDESDYYDADEENSVDTQSNVLFLQGSLHPMNISSSSRSYKNPLVISEESNAEILDSFSWNYSGFLQWVPMEKVQSWFTCQNLFYIAILIALKIGIFLIFGYMLFGSTIDEDKMDVTMNVGSNYLNSDLIPWSTTFRKTDILRDLIRTTTEKSKSSSVLLSTPISWTHEKDVMEFILCTPKFETMINMKLARSNIDKTVDPLALEGIEPDLIVHKFSLGTIASQRLFGYTLVLNKYNTIKDHISPITIAEFALWYWSLYQANAVGFYNSNRISGASQLHKHLQLIPLDNLSRMRNSDAIYPLPLDDLILPLIEDKRWDAFPIGGTSEFNQYVYEVPQFDFNHALVVLDNHAIGNIAINDFVLQNYAAYLQYIYRRLLLSLGINEEYLIYCSSVGITDVSCLDGGKYFIKNAYNVVLTTSYILVLPRSASHNELNVNAMGFMGLLLAHSPPQNDILENQGPYAVLKAVSTARMGNAG